MRSLSGSVRSALLAAALLLAACASRRHPPESAIEPVVVLEGEVALSGSNQIERDVVLFDAGGTICRLEGGRTELELRSLAGLGVRVTGRLAGRANDLREFLVDRWELLPIDGRAPLVGAVESRGGAAYLVEERDGTAYLLDGPLAKALEPFVGYKVWVAGETRAAGEQGARETALVVGSYGVLLPPRSVNRSP
jgi:hypothetical protein